MREQDELERGAASVTAGAATPVKAENFRVLGHAKLGGKGFDGDVWAHRGFAYVGIWSGPTCPASGVKVVGIWSGPTCPASGVKVVDVRRRVSPAWWPACRILPQRAPRTSSYGASARPASADRWRSWASRPATGRPASSADCSSSMSASHAGRDCWAVGRHPGWRRLPRDRRHDPRQGPRVCGVCRCLRRAGQRQARGCRHRCDEPAQAGADVGLGTEGQHRRGSRDEPRERRLLHAGEPRSQRALRRPRADALRVVLGSRPRPARRPHGRQAPSCHAHRHRAAGRGR